MAGAGDRCIGMAATAIATCTSGSCLMYTDMMEEKQQLKRLQYVISSQLLRRKKRGYMNTRCGKRQIVIGMVGKRDGRKRVCACKPCHLRLTNTGFLSRIGAEKK